MGTAIPFPLVLRFAGAYAALDAYVFQRGFFKHPEEEEYDDVVSGLSVGVGDLL